MSGASASTLSGAFVNVDLRDRTAAALSRTMRRMQNFANGISRIGRQIATVSFFPGLGIFNAVRQFATFEESLLAMQAATKQAAGTSFDQVEKKVRSLGQTTSFTAQQVAEASVMLGRGGFDTKQLEESLDDVLALARATRTELPDAAETVIDLMNAFDLSGAEDGIVQSQRAVDVLTFATNNSSQNLEELKENMKLVGAVAGTAGIRIEEAAAAAAVLASGGIKGSIAGTAIRRAIVNIAADAGDARKELEGMGIAVRGRDVFSILRDFQRELSGLSEDESLAKQFQVLGIRGLFAGGVFKKANSQFDDMVTQLDATSGSAADAAQKIDSGLNGALLKTVSVLNEFQLAIGEAFSEDLQAFLEWLREGTGHLIEFAKANKEVVVRFVKATAIAFAFGASLVALAAVIQTLVFTLGSVVAGVLLVVNALTSLQFIIAAIPASIFIVQWNEEIKTSAKEIVESLELIKTGFSAAGDALMQGDLSRAFKIASVTISAVWRDLMMELKFQLDQFLIKAQQVGIAAADALNPFNWERISERTKLMFDPNRSASEYVPAAFQKLADEHIALRDRVNNEQRKLRENTLKEIEALKEVIIVEPEILIDEPPPKEDLLKNFERDRKRREARGDLETFQAQQKTIAAKQDAIRRIDEDIAERRKDMLQLQERTEGIFSGRDLSRRFAFADRAAGETDPTIKKLEEQKKVAEKQLTELEKLNKELRERPLPSHDAAEFILNFL